MLQKCVGVCVVVYAFAATANADVVLNVNSGGQSSLEIQPGSTFTVSLNASTGAGEVFNSLITRLVLSQQGMELLSYSWQSPFTGAAPFEDSTPRGSQLPLPITNSVLARPFDPENVADLELSNVVPSGVFTGGLTATLTFRVPQSMAFGVVTIWAEPDTIANGFDVLTSSGGTTLTVNIVPTPTAVSLLGVAFAASRRRPVR